MCRRREFAYHELVEAYFEDCAGKMGVENLGRERREAPVEHVEL